MPLNQVSVPGRQETLDRIAEPHDSLEAELAGFRAFGTRTRLTECKAHYETGRTLSVPTYINEFWTSKQRAASSLHEISYRACFKPQLPRFFIERLTEPGDIVYDPFMGRGTTLLEAALLGRLPYGCDVNPLSRILIEPRLHPPELEQLETALEDLGKVSPGEMPPELLAFYHKKTLSTLSRLRRTILEKEKAVAMDDTWRWIRMVAVNRLTGHSCGFFSVYTLPPNQAVSVSSQVRINKKLGQVPEARDVGKIIIRKSKSLLRNLDEAAREQLSRSTKRSVMLTGASDSTPEIPSESVSLIVTSPPFLDVVDYAGDNWLRCWFCGISPSSVNFTTPRKPSEWEDAMARTFSELRRILRKDGHVAFEVGDVRGGKVKLEESVLRCATSAGLTPRLLLINDQEFTKTSNCWGVENGQKGTNTNRVVLLKKQ